jgi:hypothetical protein
MRGNLAAAAMLFIPYRRLRLQSALSMSETIEAIAAAVQKEREFAGWSKAGGEFDFNVRQLYGRNSFLPSVNGCIEDHAGGCVVSLTMTLQPFVAIFVLAMLGTVLGIAASEAAMGNRIPLFALVPVWMLCVWSFARGTAKVERVLRQALKTPEAQS